MCIALNSCARRKVIIKKKREIKEKKILSGNEVSVAYKKYCTKGEIAVLP